MESKNLNLIEKSVKTLLLLLTKNWEIMEYNLIYILMQLKAIREHLRGLKMDLVGSLESYKYEDTEGIEEEILILQEEVKRVKEDERDYKSHLLPYLN